VIARDYITAWRAQAPWVSDHQVEQDLVISRALVQIFNVEGIGRRLAFRGGTALYKLYLRPAARYSEDIDLVQVTPEAIGDTFDAVRSVLDPWLGTPRRDLREGRVSLVNRFTSEDEPPKPLRLKIEVNSREHFTEHGHVALPVEVRSEWWSGEGPRRRAPLAGADRRAPLVRARPMKGALSVRVRAFSSRGSRRAAAGDPAPGRPRSGG
jgi:hypothetical protein